MENNINDNNINFNVTGHTKIWHKEAGKTYDDPRGELVTDSKNTISTLFKDYLANSMVAINNTGSAQYLGSSGYVTLAANSVELNTNLAAAGAATPNIDGKDAIIIGNSSLATTTSSTIFAMSTSTIASGASNAKRFQGVFTKTSAGDVTFNSAALGFSLIQKPAAATALVDMFESVYATQVTPTFSRLMKQNDTLTIEWTITINN
jgi:hypothetical protein